VIELDRQGNYTAPVTVLETDYHLSYPCVFEWQDEVYMIPETRADRSIQLYRCTEFPGEWELDTVLLDDLNATDATVMEHNGRWWMFANVGEKHYPSDWDELSIFHAETLRGPWLAHSQIRSNLTCAVPDPRERFLSGAAVCIALLRTRQNSMVMRCR